MVSAQPSNKTHSHIKRLKKEKRPLRFLLSRMLLRAGVNLPYSMYFSRAHNVKTYLHASSAAHKLFIGKYKPQLDIAVFEKYIKPGDVVFDVGANIGMFTSLASRLVGDDGRVYAFEPTVSTFTHLMENLELNLVNNTFPVYGAVSDSNSEVFFHDHPYSKEQNHIEPSATEGKRVKAYRLDSYMELVECNKIDFLKIDVEGAELINLRSLGERINDVQVMYIEFSAENFSSFGYTQEDLKKYLEAYDFKLMVPRLQSGELHLSELNENTEKLSKNVVAVKYEYKY